MVVRSLDNLAISETGFVFDPRTGATFNVNSTGLVVLRGLRDGKGMAEISEVLCQEFEAPPIDVLDQIVEFTQLLRHHGLLSEEQVARLSVQGAPQ